MNDNVADAHMENTWSQKHLQQPKQVKTKTFLFLLVTIIIKKLTNCPTNYALPFAVLYPSKKGSVVVLRAGWILPTASLQKSQSVCEEVVTINR